MSARDVIARYLADVWPVGAGDLNEADRIISALSAAGWVVEQGWQPIETAPRDGTWIWCWHEEQRWKRVGMRSTASGPRWYYSSSGFNAQYADDAPTHWRPLPAAPEARDDA